MTSVHRVTTCMPAVTWGVKRMFCSKLTGTKRLADEAPILRFTSLRQKVYNEMMNYTELQGIPWQRFPALTKIMKGHRRGEVTVLSGPTGSGKTTFLSESSLDLCLQGVRTLWGSFEIKNTRLCRLMLTQFAQRRIEYDIESFDKYADAFSCLPMHFMDFHGQQSLKSVLETMSVAVTQHNVDHVILDNLQFMIGSSSTVNRFDYQDMVIGSLRKFATEHNCHVTIVIHPRKQKLDEELTNNSIFGGAKATQEADNIFLLQVRYTNGSSFKFRKYLQVTKNRFDGDMGIIPLSFDKESLSFGTRSAPETTTRRSDLNFAF